MSSPAGQRVRGVLAALALLAFVAGIPSGLLALGADPARLTPDRWPDPVPISHWSERIWTTLRWAWITGDLLIWLIVAIAWTGWLALTVSVIVEVIRQTGHGAHRLLTQGPSGRWIAGLVAAVLVATSTGAAAAAGLPATPTASTAPPWPHPEAATSTREPAAGEGDAVPYTVSHGDTLWDLAERYLGNGTRYHEIVRLNSDLLADHPDNLEPAWTLLFPADAVSLPPRQHSITEAGRTVTVQAADTLTAIAERHLGDQTAWRALFDLNAGRPQPDGRALRHPDRLLPGWNLVLPAAPVPSEAPTGQPVAPPRAESPAPKAPESPPVSVDQLIQQPDRPRDDEQHAPTTHDDSGISLPGGAFVGLGLAALITLAVITVRIRLRRWYQPGSPEHADHAGQPVVRALRIAHDTATRVPADGDKPVAVPAPSDRARPAEMDHRDRALATVRAMLLKPQETLVGVRDGHAVALNLARTQGLGLVGPGAHAAARALIVTLLAQATGDFVDATIMIPTTDARSLFGHDLPDHVPERLRIVDDMPAALDALEAEVVARARADDLALHDLPTQARHLRSDNRHLLLVAAPTAETDRRAHIILENGSHLGLAGVFLGPWRPGGTARVREDGTVEATSPTINRDLTGARLFVLPDTDANDLLALLQAAASSDKQDRNGIITDSSDDPATRRSSRIERSAANPEPPISEYEFIEAVPGPASVERTTSAVIETLDRHQVAETSGVVEAAAGGHSARDNSSHYHKPSARRGEDRTDAEQPAEGSRLAEPLHLQVVGRLRLIRANPEPHDIIEALAPRQREILVYLALHREGCRRESLSASLWPNAPGERPYNSFHATLSQLRRALRRETEDNALDFIVNRDGYYGLDQTVVTVDLWRLQDVLAAGRCQSSADATVALNWVDELYRGDLADGMAADWVEGPREALRREVLDAFGTVIRKVRNDDLEQALALLEKARRLDPYNEAIYRDLMRMQARLGHYDSIPRTLHLLTTALTDLDLRPARDTVGLADALQSENRTRNRQAS